MNDNIIYYDEEKESLVYDGRIIHDSDVYSLKGKHKVKFKFISSNNVNEHGVILDLGGNFDGDIFWEGRKFDIPNVKFPTLDLFEKDFGKELTLDIDLRDGEIYIFNGVLDGKIVRFSEGNSGMLVDEFASNKKKYHCSSPISNDFDFDDFVFEIEILD
ncbi:MAG: hypothetical protein IJN90_05930 [Bacilli bacterium]|nr:hypothetical protein [Bacilli bacterium]